MTQETAWLDYTDAPPMYDIGPDTCDNAGGWFWIRGPQNGEGDRGDIGSTEANVLADAWSHYKQDHDPPGMRVDMGIGVWRFAWKVRHGEWSNINNPMWNLADARAAAWAWHDRRRAIVIDIDEQTCSGGKHRAEWMSIALTWTDAECAEVEAYAALPFPRSVDMPSPLQRVLLPEGQRTC